MNKQIPNNPSNSVFEYEKFFEVLEKFIFSYSIVTKSPSNKVQTHFAQFSEQLRTWARENTNFDDVQRELQTSFYDKINAKIPNRDEFKKLVKQNIKYTSKNIPLCHYYLHEIENKVFGNIITSEATIEHIIPRTPKKWRLKAKEVPGLHHIGNLILLEMRLNSGGAGNKVFNEKLNTYRRSTYHQMIDFVDNYQSDYDFSTITRSNMTAIENRSDIVSEIMATIWIDYLNELTD